ncbi:unnamed protein product [Calypogeia fissa]
MSKTYRHPYKGGALVDWAHWGPKGEGGEDMDMGYVQREKMMLDYVDKLMSQPELEQRLHLQYILKKNANTEYLQKHGMNGATDVDTFRKRMPVVDYSAYRESVERIANGDKSPILSADPPLEILVSSGTTGGDPKLFPVNGEDLGFRGLVWSLVAPTLSRVMPTLKEGKFLNLVFLRAGSVTPGGLPTRTAVTSYIYSIEYQQRMFHPIYNLSSPNEVLETPDTNSAMYSHLLCALLQRHEIRRIGAIYATVVVKALRALETWWAEICHDIATGTVNETIVQDQRVRESVLPLFLDKGAKWRAEQAESIRKECISEDGVFNPEGIIPRLWPNCEVIDTGGTGIMKAYLPSLSQYSDNLRIICTPLYSATEGFFGINMNPSLPPEETFYVLMPAVAYYEFIAIPSASPGPSKPQKVHPSGDNHDDEDEAVGEKKTTAASEDQVLDLVNLEVGQQYEIVVTTISGYCRLRMGDILEVVGKYNNSPLFKFVRRKNILLSVDHDKTDEMELHAAVRKAVLILEEEMPGTRLLDYTSFTELVEPGRYVIVWELTPAQSSSGSPSKVQSSLLDRCCTALEASLNFVYREGRYEGIIGPLELNLVQPGTFDLLCEYAVNLGASLNQYKVPRGLGPKNSPLRDIVEGRVMQRHFSTTKPPFTPSTYKTKKS